MRPDILNPLFAQVNALRRPAGLPSNLAFSSLASNGDDKVDFSFM
jgi:hypothetical protein